MGKANQRVVVLGASDNPERYSNMAVKLLMEKGHTPVPVTPKGGTVAELAVLKTLSAVEGPVDTLTLYVGAPISTAEKQTILNLRPGRVIFNPGAENPELREALEEARIPTLEACTLVLLRTGQF